MGMTRTRAFLVGAGIVAASFGVAAPAGADPGDDPCPLSKGFLCRFLPIAPGLDHDIDLTQGPATLNGESLPQMPEGALHSDNEAPTPICANGCG